MGKNKISKITIATLTFLASVGCNGKTGPTGPAGPTGVQGETGPQGAAGLSIKTNRLLSASTTNFCTQYTSDACNFTGGQIVEYTDNTTWITGTWEYLDFNDFNSTVYDSDSNTFAITMLVPPTVTVATQTLSDFVARGSGLKDVFLKYSRTPESVTLVYDANDNHKLDTTDTALETVRITNW